MSGTAAAGKLSGIRAVIAERMLGSLHEAAQLTYFADADITGLLEKRATWKEAGRKIGIEDCIIAALARALAEFPSFNAHCEGDTFTPLKGMDIAVAISSPAGLMTPVVRSAQSASLDDIAASRRDLVARAMEGRLKVSEMKGGSFTISNLGLTRVQHFTPILNRPQVALLGLGRIEPVARPHSDGGVLWGQKIGLSLTADHRVVDGDPSGQFLARICEELEDFAD